MSSFENLVPDGKPFFYVKTENSFSKVEGLTSCSIGHRIPRSGQFCDDGVYISWFWNGRRLTVENDRYGLYPLFYCAKNDSISVSPSLEYVVSANSERILDLPALAVFFRLGHFVGEDTPFSDIRFLPPGSVLTWEDGLHKVQTREVKIEASRNDGVSFDEAVEVYRELFAAAVSRRLPSNEEFTVPISGGRDSRHILFELARQGACPRSCLTVKYRPPATNEDARVARIITDRLRIEHLLIEKPDSFFRAELREIRLTNYCGGGHGWMLPLASKLVGNFKITYDGLAGDILSAGFLASDVKKSLFQSGELFELARLILSEAGNEGALKSVLESDFFKSLSLESAVERLVVELRRHASEQNPVTSFLFWNRTRRCIGSIPFAILHQIPVVYVPYLDHALFDFLFSLDTKMLAGGRLHDETIRRAYPKFSDIPYEDKSVIPVFGLGERSYYRRARKELFWFLCQTSALERRVVKSEYLLPRIVFDLASGRTESPWYLRTALQAIELERLRC